MTPVEFAKRFLGREVPRRDDSLSIPASLASGVTGGAC